MAWDTAPAVVEEDDDDDDDDGDELTPLCTPASPKRNVGIPQESPSNTSPFSPTALIHQLGGQMASPTHQQLTPKAGHRRQLREMAVLRASNQTALDADSMLSPLRTPRTPPVVHMNPFANTNSEYNPGALIHELDTHNTPAAAAAAPNAGNGLWTRTPAPQIDMQLRSSGQEDSPLVEMSPATEHTNPCSMSPGTILRSLSDLTEDDLSVGSINSSSQHGQGAGRGDEDEKASHEPVRTGNSAGGLAQAVTVSALSKGVRGGRRQQAIGVQPDSSKKADKRTEEAGVSTKEQSDENDQPDEKRARAHSLIFMMVQCCLLPIYSKISGFYNRCCPVHACCCTEQMGQACDARGLGRSE